MATDQHSRATQSQNNLQTSASLADTPGPPTSKSALPPKNQPTLLERHTSTDAIATFSARTFSCEQLIRASFFFDGTGNNLEADSATNELSNVAKLYLAHIKTDSTQGNYRFYIPGIGTYFKEINDPGGTTAGLGFGDRGQDRLNWAMDQLDQVIKNAEALACNSANKIVLLSLSAFGFSRGATLARAFARDLQSRCRQTGSAWQLKKNGFPVRFYFLGLWDTVASIGLPMSANNTSTLQSAGWRGAETAMRDRNNGANGVRVLAFGLPGADPAPGLSDGHSGWAHTLDIPGMVEKCVHMVAAHEIRNSFPLDSCRRGGSYTPNIDEMVYPGTHSDVGGGYRPGEGARSKKPGQMLSLLPLRVMHRLASNHGVPLYPLTRLPYEKITKAFAADEESKPELDRMTDLWQHYMNQAGMGGLEIGRQVNAHMRLYYGWRFYKVRQNRSARAGLASTQDQAELERLEPGWRAEHQELAMQINKLKREVDARQAELTRAEERLCTAKMDHARIGTMVNPSLQADVALARKRFENAMDEYLKTKARQDTLPGIDGSLARNLEIYDNQLMADAEIIREALANAPTRAVRPHYRNLLDAFEAEFIRDNGLHDEKIIEFFDAYVHDSLADFGKDATLPSDPRVIYVGGDVKSRHAENSTAAETSQQG